jgi:hypothetical protein
LPIALAIVSNNYKIGFSQTLICAKADFLFILNIHQLKQVGPHRWQVILIVERVFNLFSDAVVTTANTMTDSSTTVLKSAEPSIFIR